MNIGDILAIAALATFLLNGFHWLFIRPSRFSYYPRAGALQSVLTFWGAANAALGALTLARILPFVYFALLMTAYVVFLELYAIYSRGRSIGRQP